MINAILNGLLKFFMSILNIILSPINALFTNAFPNISTKISSLTNTLDNLLGNMAYALEIIPNDIKTTLIFIFTCELTLFTIKQSYKLIIKIPKILKEIKFW